MPLGFWRLWAWAIIHGGKDIENRTWAPRYRGPLLIHAGRSMRISDFKRLCERLAEDGINVPKRTELLMGGIIGQVELTDCVEDHASRWFGGPVGWVLKNAKALKFEMCRGQLGLFDVGSSLR
jgi:hypothetical protein